MDASSEKRFREMWAADVPLLEIAHKLGYSFQSLAKWRMLLGMPKRYGGHDDDGEIPCPAVIRLRCLEQQTNWTQHERRLRWRGPPHTVYASVTTHD